MAPDLRELVRLAGLAPSGDNTQPWRFTIDAAAGVITLLVDESRDHSPMNSAQRMARIACGTAWESLVRAAVASGFSVHEEPLGNRDPGVVARARITAGTGITDAVVLAAIAGRCTNRRPYDGTALVPEVVAALTALSERNLEVMTDRRSLEAAANVIGRADAILFGERAMRTAFLANVRFEAPPLEPVEEGLSLGSIEALGAKAVAIRMLRYIPQAFIGVLGVPQSFCTATRQLVMSAGGLCLISAEDEAPATDVHVGRLALAAWIRVVEFGLSAQPMMSLPVLENALRHGAPDLRQRLRRAGLERLFADASQVLPAIGKGRLAFVLRIGRAPAPSARVGRRPLAQLITSVP